MNNPGDLPDVNLLFAIVNQDHAAHMAASQWFDCVEQFALTPVTLNGLLRLLLNPVAMPNTPAPRQALRAVDSLRAAKGAVFWPDDLVPGSKMRFAYAISGHRQVTDLHLLNLAAAHGGRLVTFNQKITAVLNPRDRKYVCELTSDV